MVFMTTVDNDNDDDDGGDDERRKSTLYTYMQSYKKHSWKISRLLLLVMGKRKGFMVSSWVVC